LIKECGDRPPWGAYQVAAAEQLDALLQFCQTQLGLRPPRSLAMAATALLRLAASDEADHVLLTEKARKESGRGEKVGSTVVLKAAAAVIMELFMRGGKGRGQASEMVAAAISADGYDVKARTVESWRDAGRSRKSPFKDEYYRQLAMATNVHLWPDNPFGPPPEIASVDEMLRRLAAQFASLPR
jgi:hypothetical protein